MSQKKQILTKRLMRFAYVLWFWGLILSVLLVSGCKELPVKPNPVEADSPAEAASNVTSQSLLVLYKSSEGDTAEGNIFVYYLQPFALSQNYKLMYHDIDKSFPSDAVMKDTDAIVTVYNGPIMKNAKGYIEWLTQQSRDNKKIVIIGNFGAFSTDGKEWYDGSALNTFYHEMGLEFAGHWTNDPKLIKVAYKDPKMIGYETDITPKALTHYFLIKSVHPDNVVYLSLMRNDLEESTSAVVVKTPNGGMAMENYVFTPVAGQTKQLLHLERFFVECLQ
jgi:hypothetical protein